MPAPEAGSNPGVPPAPEVPRPVEKPSRFDAHAGAVSDNPVTRRIEHGNVSRHRCPPGRRKQLSTLDQRIEQESVRGQHSVPNERVFQSDSVQPAYASRIDAKAVSMARAADCLHVAV